jgi:hypothetical protein
VPSTLIKTLLSEIPEECRIKVCCQKGGTGRFELRFRDGTEQVATATRTFNLAEKVVNHAGFNVVRQRRGRGLAKLLTRNSLAVYRELGISRVTLSAGLEAGGYVWARFGFLPSREDWFRVRGDVQAKLTTVGEVPAEAKEALTYALVDDDPVAIWDIADLDAKVDDTSLGRLLLSGTAWEGLLEFSNVDAMDRFDAYVATNKGGAR